VVECSFGRDGTRPGGLSLGLEGCRLVLLSIAFLGGTGRVGFDGALRRPSDGLSIPAPLVVSGLDRLLRLHLLPIDPLAIGLGAFLGSQLTLLAGQLGGPSFVVRLALPALGVDLGSPRLGQRLSLLLVQLALLTELVVADDGASGLLHLAREAFHDAADRRGAQVVFSGHGLISSGLGGCR